MSVYIFTGLVPEAERKWKIGQLQLAPCGPMDRVEEKLFSQPPTFVKPENQQQTNTCAANAGTTCLEKLAYIQSGEMVQLSRNYAYARGQKLCGLWGQDKGITLSGCVAAMKGGLPLEELWPFTGVYQPHIPNNIDEAALAYKLTSTIDVERRGYDGFREVIGQNIGSVLMACSWPLQRWSGNVIEAYQPQGSGGHAIAAVALSTKRDSRQRPYVWVANSHAGDPWLLWSPDAIDQVIQRDEWGSTGLTDMVTPKPRKFDWSRESFFS